MSNVAERFTVRIVLMYQRVVLKLFYFVREQVYVPEGIDSKQTESQYMK